MEKMLTAEQEDLLRKAFVCALKRFLMFKDMSAIEILSMVRLEPIPDVPFRIRCVYGELRQHELEANGLVDFNGDFTQIGATVISVNTLTASRTHNHTFVLDNIEQRFAKILEE